MDAMVGIVAQAVRQGGWVMRTGRKLGRTLYLQPPPGNDDAETDVCVGIVDSEALAAAICERWNRVELAGDRPGADLLRLVRRQRASVPDRTVRE